MRSDVYDEFHIPNDLPLLDQRKLSNYEGFVVLLMKEKFV